MPGRWFGDSSSPAKQGEETSWTSPSVAGGRGVSSLQLTLVIWQKRDFANIAMERLLFYKTKFAEICQKDQKKTTPRF